MVGPSASGSEKGPPTSTKSAPAACTARRTSRDTAAVGNPAVTYGISALFGSPSVRQRAAIGCSDKVVADGDAVFDRVGDFDDGPRVAPLLILGREVDDGPGLQQCPVGRRHDAHDRTMHVRH